MSLKYQSTGHQRKWSTHIDRMIDTARNFSSTTSIHGMVYVGSHEHSKCGRSFWIVAVALAIIGTAFQLFSILNQWNDQLVVTNLDTISLPVEDVDFPSVTLCPQGATEDVMDNVLYQQFQEWLFKKTDTNLKRMRRDKRQNQNYGCGCNVPKLGSMLIENLKCCFKEFLDDVYPEVYPNIPTSIAGILNTDEPDQVLENEAILLPKKVDSCKDEDEILDDINNKLKRNCPTSFIKKLNDTTCLKKINKKMTYSKALTHCKEQMGATLFAIDQLEDLITLDDLSSKSKR